MTSAFESNPGRFNLLRAGAVPVLVDSPSCVNDVEALRAVVDRLPPLRPRSVAIAHAGDYPDDNLARFAAAFAGGFDRYVCYDWEELRGRRPGEAAALLGAALVAAGVDPGRVAVIPDEREALRESVAMAGDGGLAVLVMQDETDPMRAVLAATGIDGWNFESVAAWLGRAGAPLVNGGALG
jgi:cyanophycin synthetase